MNMKQGTECGAFPALAVPWHAEGHLVLCPPL